MLEFFVNGLEAGEEIILKDEATIKINGRVSFDPARDDLTFIELIQNGTVIERVSRVQGGSDIVFDWEVQVDQTSWFVRGYGNRIDENSLPIQ